MYRFQAKKEQLERFQGLFTASQAQKLALTVLHVPCSLDSGPGQHFGILV
jgi:hypothetical protein